MSEPIVVRQQRAARNQAIFREVNERLEELGDSVNGDDYHRFVCECATVECVLPVELTIDEYESVRREGSTFVVAVGHVYPDVERVVLEGNRFTVVEKLAAGAELARAHDPRAGTS